MIKKTLLVTLIVISMLLISPAFAPQASQAARCQGQYVIHNFSSYIVEATAMNDSDSRLDVPSMSEMKGIIVKDQPIVFTMYRAGYPEKILGSAKILKGCDFDGDLQIWAFNYHAEVWYVRGFEPVLPLTAFDPNW